MQSLQPSIAHVLLTVVRSRRSPAQLCGSFRAIRSCGFPSHHRLAGLPLGFAVRPLRQDAQHLNAAQNVLFNVLALPRGQPMLKRWDFRRTLLALDTR